MKAVTTSISMRRFFHSSAGCRSLVRRPRRDGNLHRANQSPSSVAAATSRTAKADAVAIMDARYAGYLVHVAYGGQGRYTGNAPVNTAALNPLAPGFNPSLRHHPAYGLPLGQANEMLPYRLRAQPSSGSTEPNTAATRAPRRSRSPSPKSRDEKVAPSPESGGVPDPTPEYLALASHPPFLLPQPRNILVVIDLNGTLLHRPNRRQNPSHFVERPHARSFLSYCINTFTVVIWSSARPQNVSNMCRQLMTPEDSAKVVAVWSRDTFRLTTADYNRRVQCYKRLTALWNDPIVAASHPMAAKGEKWSQLNTVLVDDSIEKARSEPFNLVGIPEFDSSVTEPGFVLPQVHDYLNECSRQANVSAYIKGKPFQLKPDFTL
ncbi:HAD-like domain-containing protein [Xylaria palmicola]|nr:HAD-like domain-containing protein [Xylaria palmicola]